MACDELILLAQLVFHLVDGHLFEHTLVGLEHSTLVPLMTPFWQPRGRRFVRERLWLGLLSWRYMHPCLLYASSSALRRLIPLVFLELSCSRIRESVGMDGVGLAMGVLDLCDVLAIRVAALLAVHIVGTGTSPAAGAAGHLRDKEARGWRQVLSDPSAEPQPIGVVTRATRHLLGPIRRTVRGKRTTLETRFLRVSRTV